MDNRPAVIHGQSPTIARLRAEIARLASLDTPVFITGESGSGARLATRAIHQASARRAHGLFSFESVPGSPLAPLPFGYRAGVFGEDERVGWLAEEAGSSFVLPELYRFPGDLQRGLVRVIRERTACRVRDDKPTAINVRLISFAFLYPRQLKAIGICAELAQLLRTEILRVPPLREYLSDLPELAQSILVRYAAMEGRAVSGFSAEAIERPRARERRPSRNVLYHHGPDSPSGPYATELIREERTTCR